MREPTIAVSLSTELKQKLNISWFEYLALDYILQRTDAEASGMVYLPPNELAAVLCTSVSHAAQVIERLLERQLLASEAPREYRIGAAYYAELGL